MRTLNIYYLCRLAIRSSSYCRSYLIIRAGRRGRLVVAVRVGA